MILRRPTLRERIEHEEARKRDLDVFDYWTNRPPRSLADEIGRHLFKSRQKQRGFLDPFRFVPPVGDPFFSNVSILLPLNGANGGTTFTDASSFAHTVTRFASNTTTTTSTAQSKWGGSSMYQSASTSGLQATGVGSEFTSYGNYSFELWTQFASGGSQYLFDHGAGNAGSLIIVPSSGNVQLYDSGAGGHIINATGAAGAFSLGQWYYHQALRTGSTNTYARDGVSQLTGSNSNPFASVGSKIIVGNYGGGGIAVNGYIQDFRATKSVGRAIALPTAAFPTF